MESTSTSTRRRQQRRQDSEDHTSSPDPTLKALKAGEELIDALDHAFAEFENERLEISMLGSSSFGVLDDYGIKEEELKFEKIVLDNDDDDDDDDGQRNNGGLSSSFAVDTPAADADADSLSSSRVAENSEVSDESNTEQVLEQELEKRVYEWIQKVESGQQEDETLFNDIHTTTTRQSNHEDDDNDDGTQEQEQLLFEGTNVPSLTPCKGSTGTILLQHDTLPLTSIKTKMLEQLVSPLAIVDGEFGDVNVMCDENQSIDKERNVLQKMHLKDELEMELDNDQWDQENNQWDFDDVDSLPSEHDAEKSNATANDDDDDAKYDGDVDYDDAPKEQEEEVDQVQVDDPLPIQELKSHPNLEVQTNLEHGSKTILDQQNESPSPNDVVASLPFFNAQTGNHPEDCSKDDDEMRLDMDQLQEQLQKEKATRHDLKCELDVEKSKRLQVEKELLKIKDEYANAQKAYETDRNEFYTEYEIMKMKTEEAEKDAQEAIALAEEAAASRSEMEGYLQRALDELENLKKIVQESGHENVGNNAAEPLAIIQECDGDGNITDSTRQDLSQAPVRFSPRRIDFRKAGISAGRQLLRHAIENDDASFASTQDGSLCSSSNLTDNTFYTMLCRRSAEKRQRLLDRLRNIKDENQSPNDVITIPLQDGFDSVKASRMNRMLKTVELVIRKSGKSLGLGGRWFSARPFKPLKQDAEEEIVVETMTKSYCNAVEALIANQKDELNELRAFCQYLEDKMSET